MPSCLHLFRCLAPDCTTAPLTQAPLNPVLDAVHARLRRWNVQGPLLVAVSGGADSIALLRCCHLLQEQMGLTVCAAHFDHGLRPDSCDDRIWVERRCEQWGIPIQTGSRDFIARGTHLEEDARRDRYAFLMQTAAERQCPWIAIGHTADDQAETVLHHIIRGTGLAGLAGVPERRELSPKVHVIRPLLELTRDTLQQWLRSQQIDWREDATNCDESLTRNWLRHQLLPTLRQRINPRVDNALQQLASHAHDSQQAIQWSAGQLRTHVTVDHHGGETHVTIECPPLRDVPSAILTALFTNVWIELNWPRQRMSTAHWRALTSLVQHSGHPTGHSLPGHVQANWFRGKLTLLRSSSDRDTKEPSQEPSPSE